MTSKRIELYLNTQHLSHGRNWLDGTFQNLPANPVGYGYLSTIMTDENGDFAEDIVITRTYTINYTSPRFNNTV